MIDVKGHILSVGLMLALAFLGLSATVTGVARAEELSRLANVGNRADVAKAPGPELTPPMIPGLRKHYIELRKRAFDNCRDAAGTADRASHERCFRDELERLVEAADAPSLTQHHVFLSQIPRPIN